MYIYSQIGPTTSITIINIIVTSFDKPMLRLLKSSPKKFVYQSLVMRRISKTIDIHALLEESLEENNSPLFMDSFFSFIFLLTIAIVVQKLLYKKS